MNKQRQSQARFDMCSGNFARTPLTVTYRYWPVADGRPIR